MINHIHKVSSLELRTDFVVERTIISFKYLCPQPGLVPGAGGTGSLSKLKIFVLKFSQDFKGDKGEIL